MVTTDLIKGTFEAIVTAHNARVAFVPMWVPALDESTETRYPAVWWGPLTSPLKKEQGLSLQKQFVIDMMFLDQTDPSRSQNELLEAHSRMDAIATQVWMRFIQLYVDNAGSFQGVELDLTVADARLQPIYDDGTKHLTGVRLTSLITATNPETCLANYFT